MPNQKDTCNIHCSRCEKLIISEIHKSNVQAYERIKVQCSHCGFDGIGIHSGILNLFNNLRGPDGSTLVLPKVNSPNKLFYKLF